jgi:hypothetical protein
MKMTAFIGNPGDRVLVRISAVREQKGPKGSFVSLSVADDMEPGFVRLPASAGDIVSYALSLEVWTELKKLIEKKTGAKFSKKNDKNGKPYQAADRIVRLEIVVSQIKVEDLSRKVQAITIGGNVAKITTRDKRDGNGIKLED